MITIFLTLSATLLATWIARAFILNWTLKYDPVLSTTTYKQTLSPTPTVSVIVPARNEEHNIAGCLESLLAQDYARSAGNNALEIIVVDDRSEDRTAGIVETIAKRDSRVRLVRNTELPQGWTGKNRALQMGVEAARKSDFLLFVDADTRHAPANLSQAVTYAVRNEVDMLSLIIPIVNVTFWEKVVQPMTGSMLCIRYPLWRVNDPKSKTAFGNGQYILIRREVYEEMGRHEAIKGFLLEDIAMARRVKQAGRKLRLAYTPDLSSIRMYRSFGEIWRGWSRIFLSGMDRSLRMMLTGVFMMVFFSLLPYALFVGSVAALFMAGPSTQLFWFFGISTAGVALEMLVMSWLYRNFRTPASYVAFHLLGCLVGLGILFWSIRLLYSSKGVTWKGTAYDSSFPHPDHSRELNGNGQDTQE